MSTLTRKKKDKDKFGFDQSEWEAELDRVDGGDTFENGKLKNFTPDEEEVGLDKVSDEPDLSSPYDPQDDRAPQTPESAVDRLPVVDAPILDSTWDPNAQGGYLVDQGVSKLLPKRETDPVYDTGKNPLEPPDTLAAPPNPEVTPGPGESEMLDFNPADWQAPRVPARPQAREAITDGDIEGVLGKKPGRLSNLAFMLTGGLAGENRLGYNKDSSRVRMARDDARNTRDTYAMRDENALEKANITGQYGLQGRQAAAGATQYSADARAGATRYTADQRSGDVQNRMRAAMEIAANTQNSLEKRTAALNELKRHVADQDASVRLSGQQSQEGIAAGRNATQLQAGAERNASQERIGEGRWQSALAVAKQQGTDRVLAAQIIANARQISASIKNTQTDAELRQLTGGRFGKTELDYLIKMAAAGSFEAINRLAIAHDLISRGSATPTQQSGRVPGQFNLGPGAQQRATQLAP